MIVTGQILLILMSSLSFLHIFDNKKTLETKIFFACMSFTALLLLLGTAGAFK